MTMRIVVLEGAEVAKFAEWITWAATEQGPRVLWVGMDEEGVKLKGDSGRWSPGVGNPEKES